MHATCTFKVGGRSGFACSSTGALDGTAAEGTLAVLEGSGTGDLAGISGTATFRAPHGEAAIVEFDVQLP